jgi:hypothetical protein
MRPGQSRAGECFGARLAASWWISGSKFMHFSEKD